MDIILLLAGSILALVLILFLASYVKNSQKKPLNQAQIKGMLYGTKDFRPGAMLIQPKSTTAFTDILVGMAVDEERRKVCFFEDEQLDIFDYADIVASEVLTDGKTITQTSRSSQFMGAAVGTVILPGLGTLIGGLSGKTTSSDKMTSVSLKVLVNDVNHPSRIISFVGKLFDENMKSAVTEATHWHDVISVIIRSEERKAAEQQSNQTASS